MDENYIPGFTNELYSSSGMTPYGDYYYDPSMYSDAMVSPYGRMGGDYYEPIDYYDPSIYSEPNYGIDPYGRMAGEQIGMPQAVEPMGGLDIMGGGGSDMTLARPGALYGTSTASPYSKPSLTPSLDFVTNNGQQGYYFVTNAGKRAKTKANPTAFVAVDPNAQYRLVNERGKNTIVASGTGEQGLRDAYAMAQQLSTQGGKKADWYLERSDPSGNWTRIADDDPKGSDLGGFGKVLGAALPLAVSLIPGLQFAGPVLSTALAGGAGAAIAGRDPIKGAIMSGLTAAGGSVLGGPISGALNVAPKLGTAIGTGLGATAGGLATGQSLKNALLSGVTSGGLSYITPGILDELGIQIPGAPTSSTSTSPSSSYTPEGGWAISGGSFTPSVVAPSITDGGGSGTYDPDENLITTTGNKTPFTPALSVPNVLPTTGGSPLDGVVPQPDQSVLDQPAEDEIVVTGARPSQLPVSSIPINLGGLNGSGIYDPIENVITTTGSRPKPPLATPPINLAGVDGAGIYDPVENIITTTGTRPPENANMPIPLALPTMQTLPQVNQPLNVPQPDSSLVDDKTTLDDIIDYLRLAGLASSVLGGALGGGGAGDDTFTLPAGSGGLSSVFTSKLPPANIPGGVGTGGAAARPAADLAGQGLRDPKDYYRYGYGPEQSFFNYVPQGAPNTSQAYTGYAEGGYAVGGPGDGRDDRIPALLSDGEYVVDAETVALLGNGSNKAGAEMLDKFRVNLRKQKGRKLARGEFSADAKRPENYMAGRLT